MEGPDPPDAGWLVKYAEHGKLTTIDDPLVKLDVEQTLIGALVGYPRSIATLPASFRPEHYSDPYHAELHRAVAAVAARGPHWWAEHVVAALGGDPAHAAYIGGCLCLLPPPGMEASYAARLTDLARRRELKARLTDLLAEVASPHHERPLTGLVEGAVADMARIGIEPPPASDALWFDKASWVEADLPERPWVAPGYFLRRSVTLVAGTGAAGKSSLMCGYAVALAVGKPYHRMVPRQPCRVMVYDVEDDNDEQRKRMSSVLRHMGLVPDDIAQRVTRIGPNTIGTLLNRDEHTGVVKLTPAMELMRACVAAERPDVLILDPLVELHDCPENDNTAQKAIVAQFRALAVEFDMAVVLLHHTRKGSSDAGDMDAVRGASATGFGARIVLLLANMSEDEALGFGIGAAQRQSLFRVDTGKANYSPPSSAEWFERHGYRLDNGEDVAAMIPWFPPFDVVTFDTRTAIEAAIATGTPHGPFSARLNGQRRSIKRLFTDNGITTAVGQRQLLVELDAKGFRLFPFRSAGRKEAHGLRTPDGRPGNVPWLDEVDDDLAADE